VQALLRPLFVTSWLIDDFLADNGFFGVGVVLLSSASSKTAYGAAFQLAQRPGVQVVGLTSVANVAFCESLGCYHRVLTYEQLDALPADTPCVYVDFAGNTTLRRALHTRFAQLAYSCSVGGTHVDQLGSAKDLPGPRATLFFAPAQIKKRQADWGPAELGQRLVAAWQAFARRVTGAVNEAVSGAVNDAVSEAGSEGDVLQPEDAASPVAPWLLVQTGVGTEAVEAAYTQVLAGRGDPRVGHVLTV
jgi:hypothetical protein